MSPQAQAAVAAAASQFAPATDAAAAYANHALLHDIIEQAALPSEVLANRLLLGDILDGDTAASPAPSRRRPRRPRARRSLRNLKAGEHISVEDWRALPGITLDDFDEYEGGWRIVIDPKYWTAQGEAPVKVGVERVEGTVYAEKGGTRRFVVCGVCFFTDCCFSHWIDE